MFKKFMVWVGLFFGIMGCQDKGLNLNVTFVHVEGLKKDDPVIFEQSRIGRVMDVRYEENGSFRVRVEINRAFAKAVTEHARFFIVDDPEDNTKKAIEIIHVSKGGTPLEDGATVAGTSQSSVFFEQTMKLFENGLKELDKRLEGLSEQFRSIPESDDYKDLEKEVERLSEEIKKAGEAAQGKIEKEVLPQLKEELEKLRERLLELQKNEETEELLSV